MREAQSVSQEAGDNLGVPSGSAPVKGGIVVVLDGVDGRYKGKWKVATKTTERCVGKEVGWGRFWKQMQRVWHAGSCQADASGVCGKWTLIYKMIIN